MHANPIGSKQIWNPWIKTDKYILEIKLQSVNNPASSYPGPTSIIPKRMV